MASAVGNSIRINARRNQQFIPLVITLQTVLSCDYVQAHADDKSHTQWCIGPGDLEARKKISGIRTILCQNYEKCGFAVNLATSAYHPSGKSAATKNLFVFCQTACNASVLINDKNFFAFENRLP
jgi:hypothetical protein